MIITVRDDDSDYCDVQMMQNDSQVNSPSVERRSPIHQPLNDQGDQIGDECMSLALQYFNAVSSSLFLCVCFFFFLLYFQPDNF